MLTRSTQIPTAVRGKVRALVKAHKHWPVFLRKKDMISANAKNADLIEFALFYPELTAQIEAIMCLQDPIMPAQLPKHMAFPVRPDAGEAFTGAREAGGSAGIDTRCIEELAAEVEALLREAGARRASDKRAADEYKARRQAKRDEAALNDFNYVGSRHHY